jgi:hypothetical protein
MKSPRVRFTIGLMMVAVAAVGIGIIPVRWVWTSQGGTLPTLSGLRVGMSREEVIAIVGSPSSEGNRSDGTSWMSVTREGSLYWIDFDFDANGRLVFFRKDCF